MEVYVGVTLTDGSVAHMAIQSSGRFTGRPVGPSWKITSQPSAEGWQVWEREVTDDDIELEISRCEHMWARDGNSVLGWRRLTQEEHELFAQDRPGDGSVYRNALTDRGGKIEHDLDKCKALHLDKLRREREAKFADLDGQWMRAQGQGRKAEADAVEAKRQALRDLPDVSAVTTLADLKQVTLPEV